MSNGLALHTDEAARDRALEVSPAARDRRWAMLVATGVMAITLLPYLFGYSLLGLHPARGWFSWLGYNLDDGCVYYAWMRQAADGQIFQRNLFTTEPQSGRQVNLFFLLLGNIARFTHLSLPVVWQAARLILGVAFLRAVWWLLELLLNEARARRAAFLVLCFSSGLGWLPGLWRDSGHDAPMDVWQPEAITFLSLYLNPLFVVSLLLMVGVIGWLLVAERERSLRPALHAGLCGLLLGNIHTYDVITLCAVWGSFLIVRSLPPLAKEGTQGGWSRALLAGTLTAISTGYTFYLFQTETVFARRVAVETLSPPFMQYVLGYGPALILAAFGVRCSVLGDAHKHAARNTQHATLFLVVWAIVNFAVAYLPVPFQRKMLMGEHLPLSILAGIALWRGLQSLEGRKWTIGLALCVLLLSLTNGRFLLRDMAAYQANRGNSGIQRPYLYAGEVAALNWIRENAPPNAPLQPLPWITRTDDGKVAFFDTTVAALAPGLTGHPVHAGHWGETPDFGRTMGEWQRFLLPNTTDTQRKDLLRRSGVRYVIFSQKHADHGGDPTLVSTFRNAPPPYLRLVPEASGAEADVFEVVGPL